MLGGVVLEGRHGRRPGPLSTPRDARGKKQIWQILKERIGAVGALAMMKAVCGRGLVPYALGFAGEEVMVHKRVSTLR